MRLLALLPLIAACAPACGAPPEAECHVDGLGPILSEGPVYCETVAQNATRALSVLSESGLLSDAELSGLSSISVRMTRGRMPVAAGFAASLGEVTVSISMGALLHELLHVLEYRRGRVGLSVIHSGWSENGFDAADRRYGEVVYSPLDPWPGQ